MGVVICARSDCSAPFTPRKRSQRYCTPTCRAEINRRRAAINAARYWRDDYRFSLPGDGGYARKRA